ncbi:MAG: hypothetical protein L3J67_11905 [Hyphomicrobiaceae bacterium]|nr:hypothetical protein [Hyphomicrobiaceae bacterium]
MPGYLKGALFAAVAGFFVWSFLSPGQSDVDLGKVLDRTQHALVNYNTYLKKNGITEVKKEHVGRLTSYVHEVMNVEPVLYQNPIGVKMLKDASFEGFDDSNDNNVKDSDEKKLFRVEIDFEGKRLIASDSQGSGFTGSGLMAGLIGGMLMGRLMGNQRSAGVKPGSMSSRKVTSRTAYGRSRAASRSASRARSSARSGGRFGGK